MRTASNVTVPMSLIAIPNMSPPSLLACGRRGRAKVSNSIYLTELGMWTKRSVAGRIRTCLSTILSTIRRYPRFDAQKSSMRFGGFAIVESASEHGVMRACDFPASNGSWP